MTDLSKLGHFSTTIFSETKSVTPIFFFIFGVSTLSTNSSREMKKISPLEDFGANVLKQCRFYAFSVYLLLLYNFLIVFYSPLVINRDSWLRIAKNFEKKEKNSMRKSRPLKGLEVEQITS